MLEYLKTASNMNQGFFVAGVGLLGVFLVLVLFYFIIRLLQYLPASEEKDD